MSAAAATEQHLAAWQALLCTLVEPAWIFEARSGRVALVNPAACQFLGIEADVLRGTGADALLATPEDLAWWGEYSPETLQPLDSEVLVMAGGGAEHTVRRTIRPLPGGAYVLVTLRDCSLQRSAEHDREALVAELQATLEATDDGILVLDADGRLRAINRRLAQMWGMPEAMFETRDEDAMADWMRRSVVDAEGYQRRLQALLAAPLLASTERLTLHTGQVIERVTKPLWSRGRPQGRVFAFRDLTELLSSESRIAEVAGTDALTALPNRRLLSEHVAQAAANARRSKRGFALLVIDLDHFRHVNDTLGCETGDRLLVDVSQRIRGCMRSDDTLARLGGDQFALLVEGADANRAEGMARRVLSVVAQPCDLEGLQFTLTCSIGAALFPGNGTTLDELISHAEAAMRTAKDAGRGNYRLHHSRSGVDLRRQMALDHAMRQALVSGRFRLHYQPQVEMATGAVIGAEALIRWRDPQLGELPPGQFIPVAEDTGFIVAIGDWVLSQAVRQAAIWHERGLELPIAVNVSALQFQQAQFVDRVASVLAVSQLPPQLLELELTESILVRDAEEALHRLQALARLGVRLSIDDFGTGYSSLAYLKRFPIGKLKIDRSFVKGLPSDDSDAGIVRAILQMARALNMQVVAEGVETEPQRQFLQGEGCNSFQGFLFAPALDALSFERRLLVAQDSAAAAPAEEPATLPRVRLVHGG